MCVYVYIGVTCIVNFNEVLICGCENGEVLKIVDDQIVLQKRVHQSQVTALTIIESQVKDTSLLRNQLNLSTAMEWFI